MLPNGVPFPVIPQSAEIMNIIVPDMMQNALTKQDDRGGGRDDAAQKIKDLLCDLSGSPVPPHSPGLLRRIADHRADYLYILPAIGVMLLVIGYPMCNTIYLSFFNTPPNLAMDDKIFVGLDNYMRILGGDACVSDRQHADLDVVFHVLFLRHRLRRGAGAEPQFPGRGLLRGILLIPYVISAVAAAYVWRWLLAQ